MSGDRLYATDFHNGNVDVWDANMHRLRRAGRLRRPAPARTATRPFGIQAIGGLHLRHLREAGRRRRGRRAGPRSRLRRRLQPRAATCSGGSRPAAPSTRRGASPGRPRASARFSGDLLVGNFGNGRIIAFAPTTGGGRSSDGALRSAERRPRRIDGLWAIEFGNDDAAGPSTTLFFTAARTTRSTVCSGRSKR